MTWRVANIGGTISRTTSTWRVANISGSVSRQKWRVAKVSGTITATTAPVVAPFTTQTVDPVLPVTITAGLLTGGGADSYSFTATGIAFTVVGNQATFVPPGTPTGGTITVTVTATKSGNTSAPVTATFLVNPCPGYYLGADGQLHAVSLPYYSR